MEKKDLWQALADLSGTRADNAKPRSTGCTMVIDKGLGLSAYQDLLQLSGEYIDFIKLAFGTAAITPRHILEQKITLAKQYQIQLYLGGTFFEIACSRHKVNEYFQMLRHLKLDWIEISDGTITIPAKTRFQLIQQARRANLHVITEIGKKENGYHPTVAEFVSLFEQDRQAGAAYVIMESRDSGKNIGMYDHDGNLDQDFLEKLAERIPIQYVIWEAPQVKQQAQLIKRLGNYVNLGNIQACDVISLESLRRGLRADTFSLFQFPTGN
ncbi:phosphosulfolactate synthase [Laceyella putida]|uniref:Phosphosulfolactate synthase n=1 Tax=Laceyella putida TaxID=110101 RepID=A0ABW2RIV0_9BACL